MKNRFHLAVLSLATVLTLSCGEDGKSWFDDLTNQFSSLTSSNLLQNSKMGFMSNPEGVPDGNVDVIQDVKISGSALSGGSTGITVTSSEKLKELYLQIEGENGYYKWELEPEDQISINPYVYYIVLEFNKDLGEDQEEGTEAALNFIVSGLTANNEVVEKVEETLKTMKVGTGALQISLSWDQYDDLDLYVFTPSGERLYFGNKESNDGKAKLDVDSNAGCNIDEINSENVFFEAIEDGEYKVVVRLFKKCDSPRAGARYNVTANLQGTFVTFSNKQQSGQFKDTEEGNTSSLVEINTIADDATKVIGIIKIENGHFVN